MTTGKASAKPPSARESEKKQAMKDLFWIRKLLEKSKKKKAQAKT